MQRNPIYAKYRKKELKISDGTFLFEYLTLTISSLIILNSLKFSVFVIFGITIIANKNIRIIS